MINNRLLCRSLLVGLASTVGNVRFGLGVGETVFSYLYQLIIGSGGYFIETVADVCMST